MARSPDRKSAAPIASRLSPRVLRWLMNCWPPFFFTGIRVEQISDDWHEATVRLKLHWYNRNAVGTHFGGSLFAMTDPMYMLLLMRTLGNDYLVWDRSARIHFKQPGRGIVRARFALDETVLEEIRAATASGNKYEPTFHVDILNAAGETVASVEKQIYVRRKPKAGRAKR